MPVLNGFETTRMLRSAGFKGPIIGCTGNSMQDDQHLFFDCGVTSVFIKPVIVQVMLENLLENVIRHWRAGSSNE